MEFRFKLTYSPKDGESLAALLGRHDPKIKIAERCEEGGFETAVCISKSLADGLRMSRKIGAEVEILHGDGAAG